MTFKPVNSLTESRTLDHQVRTLKQQITASGEISLRQYKQLSRELGRAAETLENLDKTSNLFTKTQNAHLKEEVVNLYGALEFGLVKREVSQIQAEATSLKRLPTPQLAKELERHITALESKYLPSIPDRRVLADAKQTLLDAKAKLAGKPVMKHFDYLAQQKPAVQFVDEVQLLPEEAEELYDVARAIYNRDPGARGAYNKLLGSNKRSVEKHLQNLAAVALEDPLETMQALIATANDLVANGEGYPSSDQIDQLFIGLSQLEDKEAVAKEGKVFSFPLQA